MDRKTIPEELYWGLLFAQEDAGGTLIPGRYGRDFHGLDVRKGKVQCGCIHGAVALVTGKYGSRWSERLSRVGIGINDFDSFAIQRLRVTVDATLKHFGVDVE